MSLTGFNRMRVRMAKQVEAMKPENLAKEEPKVEPIIEQPKVVEEPKVEEPAVKRGSTRKK